MPQKKKTTAGKVRWVGRYRDRQGKEHSKTFDTQREAKAWEAEQQRAMRRGEWVDPSTHKITVSEALERWASRPGLRESSRAAYATVAANLGPIADVPLAELRRRDTDDWATMLIKGRPWRGGQTVSEGTAQRWVHVVSAAVSLAVDDGLIARNPIKAPRVKASRSVSRSQIPTSAQVAAIVERLEAGGAEYMERGTLRTQGPRPDIADMVRTAVGTGMRISELCGLRVQDVDFLRRVVRVEQQAAPAGDGLLPLKTRASRREIAVADDLLEVLDRWCAGQPMGERVFRRAGGHPIGRVGAGAALRITTGFLGLPVTFHSLRHYYASLLIDSGVSVAGVRAAMGHESASMTLSVYVHLWPGAEDQTRAAISGAVSRAGFLRDRGEDSGGRFYVSAG
ncbi:site-specific integrase [Corynebacterium sp. zg-331]|uniref:tyrosine-type recombinase/integrase n=1 Tax=unclassified Corynebacterium TaxID=2624378 RepID=UPI00128E07F6|nr:MULTISPECIES: tyrosine-type recombinase/integrase [unclassified Corynebacterium]MBC3186400.1 site-specific integrase [Corynebacterium sp. zg-331]MPV52886.1 tyrosine-type recombinase/integrase [Corynebacterium sp. zg331]